VDLDRLACTWVRVGLGDRTVTVGGRVLVLDGEPRAEIRFVSGPDLRDLTAPEERACEAALMDAFRPEDEAAFARAALVDEYRARSEDSR
jgi:hypothetical protein